MCNSSWSNASWLDETTLALCAKVLYTLQFCCYEVVAIPVYVLVCVSWFSVDLKW